MLLYLVSYEAVQNTEKATAKKKEIDDGMASMKQQLADLAQKRTAKEDEMRKLGK